MRFGKPFDAETDTAAKAAIGIATVTILEAIFVHTALATMLPEGHSDHLSHSDAADRIQAQFKLMTPNKISATQLHPTVWAKALEITRRDCNE